MAVEVDKEKCTGCKICIEVCPVNAIKVENGKAEISDGCIECSVCINQCPNEAILLPK
jgi:NAD-dependent dihydropyrimidine dehydrogenase PreA subunit